MSIRRGDLPPALLLLAAAALRGWGIAYGLPHTLTRPDEEAVFGIALRFFGRNLNPAFFDWPSLFMYTVAAGYVAYFNIGRLAGWFGREASFLAAGTTHPAPLFLIARTLSAAAGTATVATVYRIGLELFDRRTALVAAAYLAVAPLHVRESHFGLTDISATWLLTMSFLFTVRYARSGRRRDVLLAAAWAGLAASTKYNAGVVLLPAIWAVASQRRSVGDRARLIALSGLVALAAFVAGTPYAVLDPGRFAASLRDVRAHFQGGHMALAGYAWRIHLTSSLRYGIGAPMLIASVAGLVLYAVRDRRSAALFALCPIAYYAAIGAGQTAFARYILPAIPFLCLAAAYATVQLAETIARRTPRTWSPAVITAACAVIIGAPAAWSSIETDRLLSRTDNRVIAAQWLREHFPNGASMFQTGSIYGHVQMQPSGLVADPRYPEVPLDAVPPPDVIVVMRCSLAYCEVPAVVDDRLKQYVRLQTFTAVDGSDLALVYDRDDAFFVPLSGFRAVERPGPNLYIYGR